MNHWYATSGHAAVLRSSIESVHHTSIDLFLKELRHVSRRATAFSTPYHNELQLLERIYYKGKNQHRSALFWRKVLEIRRLGIRINEMNFFGFVEDLRYAFYGAEDRSK
jgi:nucleolus and neural progenitor protein